MLEAASAQDAITAYYPNWQVVECLKAGNSTYCRINRVVNGDVAEQKFVMVDETRMDGHTLYQVEEAGVFDAT